MRSCAWGLALARRPRTPPLAPGCLLLLPRVSTTHSATTRPPQAPRHLSTTSLGRHGRPEAPGGEALPKTPGSGWRWPSLRAWVRPGQAQGGGRGPVWCGRRPPAHRGLVLTGAGRHHFGMPVTPGGSWRWAWWWRWRRHTAQEIAPSGPESRVGSGVGRSQAGGLAFTPGISLRPSSPTVALAPGLCGYLGSSSGRDPREPGGARWEQAQDGSGCGSWARPGGPPLLEEVVVLRAPLEVAPWPRTPEVALLFRSRLLQGHSPPGLAAPDLF